MPKKKFEDILDDLEARGLEEDALNDLREAWDASALRKERDELKKQAQEFSEQLDKVKPHLWNRVFQDLGIKVKPDAVKLPDDLDISDSDAIQEWAVEAGLIDAPESTETEEDTKHQEGMKRIAGSRQGGTPAGGGILKPDEFKEWDRDKRLRFREENPDDYAALKRGEPVQV